MKRQSRLAGIAASLAGTPQIDRLRTQLGGLEARFAREAPSLRASEFRAFSQFGEDGIIQWLVARVPVDRPIFVEFGVEDYTESNTRFLLEHDNWRGLIIDGGSDHIAFLRRSGLEWRHWIDARSAFIDRENINGLIGGAGIEGDIGLLSIDLDGNDYWILEALEVVSPRILVCEYNSVFGPGAALTVPYDARFVRSEKHPSHLYWGASLAALDRAASAKGYVLAGGNAAGNNAFWVRRDVADDVPAVAVADAWAESRFREARGPDGSLALIGPHAERLRAIADMPVVDLDTGETVRIRDRLGGA